MLGIGWTTKWNALSKGCLRYQMAEQDFSYTGGHRIRIMDPMIGDSFIQSSSMVYVQFIMIDVTVMPFFCRAYGT